LQHENLFKSYFTGFLSPKQFFECTIKDKKRDRDDSKSSTNRKTVGRQGVYLQIGKNDEQNTCKTKAWAPKKE